MKIISSLKKWRRQFDLRWSFPIFRKKRYLYAALFQQAMAGIAALMTLTYTIIHYSDAPSLVTRYGKPAIVVIGMATLAINAYFQYLSYTRKAKQHQLIRERRQIERHRRINGAPLTSQPG